MPEVERPRDVQLFESLQIALIALGVVSQSAQSDAGPLGIVAYAGYSATIMLLASRRRKNWARLILAAELFFWCLLWLYPIENKAAPTPIAIMQILGSAVCVGLLFTAPSNTWFSRRAKA